MNDQRDAPEDGVPKGSSGPSSEGEHADAGGNEAEPNDPRDAPDDGVPKGSSGSSSEGERAGARGNEAEPNDPRDAPEDGVPKGSFDPLSEGERTGAGGNEREKNDAEPDVWEPCIPAPSEPPEASAIRHSKHGTATVRWVYRDREGRPLFATARFETVAGKEILPYTFGRLTRTIKTGPNKGQRRSDEGWQFKRAHPPLPLYGLDRLAARPGDPVLVVEGEKKTHAAEERFPGWVSITSQGGSGAAEKSDWSPLRGRKVMVWPDNDSAGAEYANKVCELARIAEAEWVYQVPIAGMLDLPTGWDLADPLPEGVTEEQLRELLGDPDAEPPAELPPGYSWINDGLYFEPPPKKGPDQPPPIFVAAHFDVVGHTRGSEGEEWGLLIAWRDRDRLPHRWAIPRRLIHAQGNEIAEELDSAGLCCGAGRDAHDLLKNFLSRVTIGKRLRCVNRTGWHAHDSGEVFVLPGGDTFGRGSKNVILQTDRATASTAFRVSGTLSAWQQGVAAPAVGNDRFVVFLSASFSGPLLDVMSEPSGGIHLNGLSRTGKSTVSMGAASVWGAPTAKAQLRSWRATANGIEAAAAESSDTICVLEEMGQADAREVGDIVYLVCNEAGKQRASRTGTARARQSWRVVLLSTGEITLAMKMAEANRQITAGLEVRLVSLNADGGAGMGVVQHLHGRPNAAVFTDEIRAAALPNHGHAGRAFLAKLVEDRAADPVALRGALEELRAAFLREHLPEGATGQVISVAKRFAFYAAAGELAREYGVLPWPEGEAMRAAGACLAVWLEERGGAGPAEIDAAMAQVRAFFETNGESRFTKVTSATAKEASAALDEPRTISRAGFRRRVPDESGGWEYLVLPQAWKAEICKGLDAKKTADLLIERELMIKPSDYPRHRADLITITGEGKRRVYRVSGKILEGGDGE
jgi:uncharacterized protein (DUF927 family)